MIRKGVKWTGYLLLAIAIVLTLDLAVAQVPSLPDEEETVRQQVTEMATTFPLTRYAGDGADVCLVIQTPNRTLSYRLFKIANAIEVTPSPYSTYCANDIYNRGPEDLVIQYVDYDSFLDHYRDSSCQNFKESGSGEDFYYLPSEFVQEGGMPVCNALFQERYCPAIRQCLSNVEMKAYGLGCCRERRIFEIPGVFANAYFLIALAILLAIVFIITMTVVHKHEMAAVPEEHQQVTPELLTYIERALALGYPPNEVENHLLQLGWYRETIDEAIGDVLKKWLVKEEGEQR